jgi:hypothetical protein
MYWKYSQQTKFKVCIVVSSLSILLEEHSELLSVCSLSSLHVTVCLSCYLDVLKLMHVLLLLASSVKFVLSECDFFAMNCLFKLAYVSLMEFWKWSPSVWYIVILVSSAKSTDMNCELTFGVQCSCIWEEAGDKIWNTEELDTLQCPNLSRCTVWI